jgi:hypothetical protein
MNDETTNNKPSPPLSPFGGREAWTNLNAAAQRTQSNAESAAIFLCDLCVAAFKKSLWANK